MTPNRVMLACSVILPVLLCGVATPASAAEGADPAKGAKIAAQHCLSCHKPKGSVPPGVAVVVPTMGDLANAEQQSSETIMLALSDPTHPLKQGTINEQQAAEVAAYILSLR